MDIVFINPSLRPDAKRRMLPVGLACVMSAVRRAGYEFDLIDMDINNITMGGLEEILKRRKYDICAFGCIVTGFRFARQIAEIIKKTNPEALIIAGNSVATSVPEILLAHTHVDVAVMGEADVTIVELLGACEHKRSFEDIQGIVFRRDGKFIHSPKRPVISDINTVEFPDWNLFELEKYNRYGRINANYASSEGTLSYPLNSARGCPYNCTFCYHVFKGERYRRYSEEMVVGEMRRLHDRFKCNFISFWDELTFPSIRSVTTMMEELGKLEYKISWEAIARGDLFRKEHLDLIRRMKELGCENVAFSLENGNPAILQAMDKKMDVSAFIEQAKVLREGGVNPFTSLVLGYPQETPETIKQTIDICEECGIFPSVGFLLPLPGTPIYEWARKHGYIGDEVEYLMRIGDRQDFHINLTAMKDEEFIGTVETRLKQLAAKMGLQLESVFKTTTYQKPKREK